MTRFRRWRDCIFGLHAAGNRNRSIGTIATASSPPPRAAIAACQARQRCLSLRGQSRIPMPAGPVSRPVSDAASTRRRRRRSRPVHPPGEQAGTPVRRSYPQCRPAMSPV
ncbi:hypothetical protein [Lysobacter gummosus]|uniref:hypothetical protein n=1 Tax=Lysobacter gummosus TaxID=262324 RepID=UPI003626CFE9